VLEGGLRVRERKRKTVVQKYERKKAGSAGALTQKREYLRPQKECISASVEGSIRESESASAKAQKSACPALQICY
jgi:hypothetical protein